MSCVFPRFPLSVRPVLHLGLLLALVLPAAVQAQKPGSAGKLKFRGSSFPVSEEAGIVTIVVKRQGGSTGEVSVQYEVIEGTATQGADYAVTPDGMLTWPDGDRSDRTFSIGILDDDLDEGQETLGVRLFEPTNGAVLSNPKETVVRIKPSDRSGDDDDGEDDDGEGDDSAGTIKLAASNFPAFESSEMATVTVERSNGSSGPVTVEYLLIPNNAELGFDYHGELGMLSWNDGEEGEKSFEVALVDDDESEGLERVTVVLTSITGDAELGVPDVGSILIIDDDGGDGGCVPDETTLCLLDGRFQVTGSWRDFDDNEGEFHWIPATDNSGLAWFFNDENVEVLFKVLEGCPINEHFWVFYAATTNVQYSIEVTDLSTGDVKMYENGLGVVSLAITDVTAFPTCN